MRRARRPVDSDEGPKPWRLFVALPLPEPVRRALGELVASLSGLPARVGWVRPENAHLTLKFLGDVPAARVDAVRTALDAVGAATVPFELVLADLGAFPPRGQVRTVWVGARDGADAARALAERLEAGLEPLGFPREPRPFAPHLTLGRVRSPLARQAFDRARERLGEVRPGRLSVDRVVLIRSELAPGAPPRYTALHEVVLGAAS